MNLPFGWSVFRTATLRAHTKTFQPIPLTGLSLIRTKQIPPGLQAPDSWGRGSSWWRVLESFSGAWQRNEEITLDTVTTHATLFACVTLTATDIAKMRMRLVQETAPFSDIWTPITSPAFSPVLRKPNHYQDRIQFFTSWILSKQLHGNTYVLKARDQRRIVVALYVLDPLRACPLVAPNGDVYYRLKTDTLSTLPAEVVVPAAEIIHDRQNTLFHPLIGLSPIYACGLAALQGLRIQENSTHLFGQDSMPGGILTAPSQISQESADRIKAYWESAFSGENYGKVALLGDGVKFERLPISAVDAQLIEQLKWTSEPICSAFHVPPYKVGIGPVPSYDNIEALNAQYYAECIQILAESIELCLDEGLGLHEGENATKRLGTEFNTDDLLRMDTKTLVNAAKELVGAGIGTPNEGRKLMGLEPVEGGDSPMMQQQVFSLTALAERDRNDPFAKPPPVPSTPGPDADAPGDEDDDEETPEEKGLDLDVLTAEAERHTKALWVEAA